MKQKYFFPAFLLLVLAGTVRSTLAAGEIPIGNFAEVAPGVYRGAAPDDEGTAYLASIHIKTDIDLETFRWFNILDERSDGHPDDIHFVSEGLWSLPGIFSYIQPPITNHKINKILSIMTDEAQKPVYVHCEKGEDRTGMVIGLYRVLVQKWAPEDAWNEMLKFGFHPKFGALTRYFEKHTGWKPNEAAPIASDDQTADPDSEASEQP
jgi:tyrosine-protein phosphatase SIW14